MNGSPIDIESRQQMLSEQIKDLEKRVSGGSAMKHALLEGMIAGTAFLFNPILGVVAMGGITVYEITRVAKNRARRQSITEKLYGKPEPQTFEQLAQEAIEFFDEPGVVH